MVEERAQQAWERYSKKGIDTYYVTFMKAYITGAQDQQAIDDADLHKRFEKVLNGQKWDLIDKACEWLKDNCRGLVSYNNASGGVTYPFIEAFRKAMED